MSTLLGTSSRTRLALGAGLALSLLVLLVGTVLAHVPTAVVGVVALQCVLAAVVVRLVLVVRSDLVALRERVERMDERVVAESVRTRHLLWRGTGPADDQPRPN